MPTKKQPKAPTSSARTAPPLKQAAATQRMSQDELADLLKKAEAEDPDAPHDDDDGEQPAKKKP
ncbi:MAG TPA: hypothetical protein VGO62_15845 [Myxococcota bacterium]|jgi:hypothetical protein